MSEYYDQRDRMIDTQKNLISRLNKQTEEMRERIDRLVLKVETLQPAHDFYMLIQKACEESPVVAGEFARFITTCRLVDDKDGGTPGLTADFEQQINYDEYPLYYHQYGLEL